MREENANAVSGPSEGLKGAGCLACRSEVVQGCARARNATKRQQICRGSAQDYLRVAGVAKRPKADESSARGHSVADVAVAGGEQVLAC